MKKVYISGKITGLDFNVAKENFANAEKKLQCMGYSPYNPMKYGEIPGFKWEDYMKKDIQLLCECDYIYPLNDWKESKGATIEMELASKLHIPVLEIKVFK